MYMMVTIAHLAYCRSSQLLFHVPQLPLTAAVIHVTYSCVYDGYCSQRPRIRNNKLILIIFSLLFRFATAADSTISLLLQAFITPSFAWFYTFLQKTVLEKHTNIKTEIALF